MTKAQLGDALRRVRTAFIFASSLALLAGAAVPLPASAGSASSVAAAPRWEDLTPEQQQALAPLQSEWNKLDSFRKNKWLAIGNKYAAMNPEQQQRLHDRMRAWASLTPEQRRVARESYARAKKLNPSQKSAHWQKYQQLPEEQKKKLAADAASRKRVANLPTLTAQGKRSKTPTPSKPAAGPAQQSGGTANDAPTPTPSSQPAH